MRRKTDTGHAFGLRAEAVAVLILRLKGYRIVARRWRGAAGEIDIIARRGGVMAFVEVKARGRIEDALACLQPRNRDRISRAAAQFCAQRPEYAGLTLRFDFIALAPPWRWRHLDNAWLAPT